MRAVGRKKPKTLRDEIRQTRPFESPAQEAILSLFRTTDMVQRMFSKIVEPHGISTLDIADRMVEQTPGITRLLDKLEAKQLVRRERRPEDRRQVLCWITGRGLRLLAQIDKPAVSAGSKATEPLSAEDLRSLISNLEKIRGQLA